jgi:hypothetical protein
MIRFLSRVDYDYAVAAGQIEFFAVMIFPDVRVASDEVAHRLAQNALTVAVDDQDALRFGTVQYSFDPGEGFLDPAPVQIDFQIIVRTHRAFTVFSSQNNPARRFCKG